jgi:hypothetical protein
LDLPENFLNDYAGFLVGALIGFLVGTLTGFLVGTLTGFLVGALTGFFVVGFFVVLKVGDLVGGGSVGAVVETVSIGDEKGANVKGAVGSGVGKKPGTHPQSRIKEGMTAQSSSEMNPDAPALCKSSQVIGSRSGNVMTTAGLEINLPGPQT